MNAKPYVNAASGARRSVASFDDYTAAQRAVDTLSDRGFPVERAAIVGSELALRRAGPRTLRRSSTSSDSSPTTATSTTRSRRAVAAAHARHRGTARGAGAAGAIVAVVENGGPADEAGLRAGDIVVEAAGRPVASVEDLLSVLRRSEPGDELMLTVMRDDERRDITVRTGPRPD